MRLIDADALREVWLASDDFDNDAINAVLYSIDEQPTVDAEPVRHGQWIDEYNGKYANPRYICSNCKGKALYDFVRDELGNWKEVQALTEFCPNCGAKMDEEVQ